ncbi:MAG: aminopeptidase P family protein [Muribaculaceae bacterium]|nr:aminopeptidase P family protein [Muribaculaceae bacterium]MDE6522742.1 aminopeptidase P family protein [Muribaculaceae bacterium]
MEKIEKKRLEALRKAMDEHDIDCCIINSTDPHQSEIPPAHWRGREWLTGFKSENGTNGIAVITKDHAYVWTDNRFFIQARQQLEGTGFEMMPLDGPEAVDLIDWVSKHLEAGKTVGIDGMTFSVSEAQDMELKFTENEIGLRTDFPQFDFIWTDRPARPLNKLFVHDEAIVGENVDSKIRRVLEQVEKASADCILISALDDIAWITNLRTAGDISFSPMFVSYLYLNTQGKRVLFIDEEKITEEVKKHLDLYNIEVLPYDKVKEFVGKLPKEERLMIDPTLTAIGVYDHIDCQTVFGGEGVAKLKSVKNECMLTHWRTAMEKDGVALVKFFKWIDEEYPKGQLTEMSLSRKLRELRLADPDCVDESFAAILGWNGHGAIVHYEPSDETDVPVAGPGLLLVDSGGQYKQGTTDITRTIVLGGEPTAEQKHDFTLVLKGHIALSKAIFPKGTRGAQLDILARQYLWNEGKAYYHGTGHGVGFFINCHEGPVQIRMNEIPVPLEPGMVMSNEPGIYIEDKYGIRCENMLAVELWKSNEFGDFYRFRNLTLFPFDLNLIEWEIITPEEKKWLEDYHREVYDRLSPLLSEEEANWLSNQCIIHNA